ncbi:MAG: type IV pilus assembly protein PilM [Candidatus Eisenbacteria sp.]|nr:type IV pilus assembly protein PilM [Candidatus Eisenbacteria bacterium]
MRSVLRSLKRSRTATCPIGVDIGATTIKLARVGIEGNTAGVRTAGIVQLADRDPEGDGPDRLREFLKDRRVRKPWRAVSALPASDAQIRILNLPAGDRASLSRRVITAVERGLPFGTDDTVLDFHSLGHSTDSGEKTEQVLLTAASRTAVDRHLEFLQGAGLIPEALELAPWALARAVQFCGIRPDATYGILDLGHTTSTIMIFEQDRLFLSRAIRAGSRVLTDKLRKELDLDWERAEQLKGERGLTLAAHACSDGVCDHGGTLVARILDDLLLPVLAHLVEEVERSIAYYASETQGSHLDRLILTGGGAGLKNLDSYLSQRLGIPVQTIGPDADGPAGLPQEANDGAGWPVLATAIGLSLRNAATKQETAARR